MKIFKFILYAILSVAGIALAVIGIAAFAGFTQAGKILFDFFTGRG